VVDKALSCQLPSETRLRFADSLIVNNKKHLKNVGPIRQCEPLHTDVYNNNDDDDDNDNA